MGALIFNIFDFSGFSGFAGTNFCEFGFQTTNGNKFLWI